MLNIKPINGYLAKQEHAQTVVCPEYDNFTPKERRHFAENHPENYINTIRYIDEFTDAEKVSYEDILKKNKAKLKEILERDFYHEIKNTLLIYQIETLDGHVQTGLMADLPFTDYENGVIRIHEYTRKDKEEGLSKYIKKVGALSTPVCIAYARHSAIDEVIASVVDENLPDVILETDIIQRVWIIKDPSKYEELSYHFRQIDFCYLADGHHRIASGHRFAKNCIRENKQHTGEESYNYLLAVLFPDEEMLIHAYNRCIRDVNLSSKTLLQLLQTDFFVEKYKDKYHAQPMHRHEFGMLLEDEWYKVIAKPHIIPDNPVGSLAVSVLQNNILNPMLGISDPQRDSRLDYISGDSGLEGMEKAIKDGFDIVFSTFPTAIKEMMEVADNNQIMPPKSTWFSPKLRSGMVISLRNKDK